MKKLYYVVPLVILTACGSIFWGQKTITDSANAGLHSWVAYYKTATNGASAARIDELNKQAVQVNQASKDFATAGFMLEELQDLGQTSTLNYTNALDLFNAQGSNLNWVIIHFMGKK